MVLVTMRPRPSRQVRQTRTGSAVKIMLQVTQIVRFLLEGGLRFRNLAGGPGFGGHGLMETATFQCTGTGTGQVRSGILLGQNLVLVGPCQRVTRQVMLPPSTVT
jgi:hypothetical protein